MISNPDPDSRAYAPRTAALPDIPAAIGRGMTRFVQVEESTLAGRTVKAPLEGVIARGRGLAAIGEGLQNLGESGARLLHEVQRAKGITAEAEAENLWQKFQNEADVAITKTPDPDDWEKIAAGAAQKFQSAMAGKKLPEFARQMIAHKSNGFIERYVGGVRINAARQHIHLARTAMQNRYEAHLNAGDFDAAAIVNRQLTEAGYHMPADEHRNNSSAQKLMARQEAAAAAGRMESGRETVVEMAKTLPPGAVAAALSDARFLPEVQGRDREYLQSLATGIARQGEAGLVKRLVDGIHHPGLTAAGLSGIWNEKMLDAALAESPYAAPVLRRQMAEILTKRLSAEDKANAREVRESPEGVKNFWRLRGEIEAWKPDLKTPQGREAATVEYIRQHDRIKADVADRLQEAAIRSLDRRFGLPDAPPADARPRGLAEAEVRGGIARIYGPQRQAAEAALAALRARNAPEDDASIQAVLRRLDVIAGDQSALYQQMEEYLDARENFPLTQVKAELHRRMTDADKVRDLENARFGQDF